MSSKKNSNGHLIGPEQRLELQLEQAVELRELFGAQKQLVQAHQENEQRIRSALTMLGLIGREITSADLGDEGPHILHKSSVSSEIT